MFELPSRYTSSLRRAAALLCIVGVLGLIAGGIPQWESHRHAPEHQDSAHHAHGFGAEAHASTVPLDEPDADAESQHTHALPLASVAISNFIAGAADYVQRRTPDFPVPELTATACCWPPPYRPPIA